MIDNVLDGGDSQLIVPRVEVVLVEDMGTPLPAAKDNPFTGEVVHLPSEPGIINDDQIADVIKKWNFFDSEYNPTGSFDNVFAATDNPEVVLDQRTSLMWQRDGLDINSIRTMQRNIEELNKKNFAGFSDWRLPSMEEAMSLMEPEKNVKDVLSSSLFFQRTAIYFCRGTTKTGWLLVC